MNLQAIAQCLGCPEQPSIEISCVGIDSRAVKPGQLFIAVKGERFDGHDFIAQAVAAGAVAIVCERAISNLNVPQLLVESALQALADIAVLHRQQYSCPAIALTGSNGKTSVKEMIAAMLVQPSFATRGNLNNHIGVPLSVLELNSSHRYAVFELGANHIGEIAHTVRIVRPQVALINNIAPAHVEGFGSIEGVARAKGEIYQGLAQGSVAVVNDDDDFAHYWDEHLTDLNVLRFSLKKPVDVHAGNLQCDDRGFFSFTLHTPAGVAQVALNVPGQHMVYNALAAAACVHGLGLSMDNIVDGLARFKGVEGRMAYKNGKNESLVIDDTYNANLKSVLTALDVLAKRRGKRIFVLGDMGELGEWSQSHHTAVGQAARAQGIDVLMTCGSDSAWTSKAFGENAWHFDSQDALSGALQPYLDNQTTVLVKGSRSAAMEKIVQQLVP